LATQSAPWRCQQCILPTGLGRGVVWVFWPYQNVPQIA
jgi:hypothetical protein